ncbi:MAG: winged helix-turn-helix transcriptional regulator [Alphaproteobacteria bacterium]|nr:winged helix-turn-helix transcriptional regulator [Alphaproteobacteria bacterium]
MNNLAISSGHFILRAMGNLRRLEILYALWKQEKSVGELEKLVGLSQSALSQHLAVLRQAGVVKTRRQAQTIFYSIKSPVTSNILNILDKFYNQRYE